MTFSIITINYNNASGLKNTIRSVVDQTSNDYEFLIIDGGSTDGSIEIIRSYTNRVHYWVSERDGGIYPAMNKGIARAQGDYCIFMNSGDIFFSNDVLRMMSVNKMTSDVICGDICFGENNISPNPEVVTMRTFYKHTIFHQACFIKTSLLKIKPYDENLKSASDWKWFMEMLVFENASYEHRPITIARFEGGGISDLNKERSDNEVLSELQKHLPERIMIDYDDYCFGTTPFRKMFTKVEQIPPLQRIIYKVDAFILKMLNLKLKAEWIKKL